MMIITALAARIAIATIPTAIPAIADDDSPSDEVVTMTPPVELGFAPAEVVLAGVVEPVEVGSEIATICECFPDMST